jgi:hypothetical protein
MESAVADLSRMMDSDLGSSLTIKWLFPEVKNTTEFSSRWTSDITTSQNDLRWKDRDLNQEQKVSMISNGVRLDNQSTE